MNWLRFFLVIIPIWTALSLIFGLAWGRWLHRQRMREGAEAYQQELDALQRELAVRGIAQMGKR